MRSKIWRHILAPDARTSVTWHPDHETAGAIVNPLVAAQSGDHRNRFETATPFKNVVIEDFLVPEFADRLLADFPAFDRTQALNEFGLVGGKAVNERLEAISDSYRLLSRYIQSAEFLQLASNLTGIPDLLPDPNLFGGGTHENRHGQDLDPHVDFNYDPASGLHRRVNLLIYLNKDWDEAWGGAIELHSNPRKPETNQITAFTPDFNRCVIFETNEYSWHGFPRINLPEDKRHLSRKSLSIYLYTRTRPADEIAPEHSTFYVHRPLPAHMQPGHTLTATDVAEIQALLARRDSWIERYQAAELSTSATMEQLRGQIDDLSTAVGIRNALTKSLRHRLSRWRKR
jgi:Rps23 Pro-64 3,4-dihydroxylase Tpa1-like proline 4-hydroxylase